MTNKLANFPSAFQCYKPRHYKVYGCICVSPNNKILLVQGTETKKWSFPKGHMEGSETAQICAFRELFEETSIVLEKFTHLGYRKFSRDGGGYFVYSVEEEYTIVPRNPNEINEGGWFTESEMRNMSCNKDVNAFLSLI